MSYALFLMRRSQSALWIMNWQFKMSQHSLIPFFINNLYSTITQLSLLVQLTNLKSRCKEVSLIAILLFYRSLPALSFVIYSAIRFLQSISPDSKMVKSLDVLAMACSCQFMITLTLSFFNRTVRDFWPLSNCAEGACCCNVESCNRYVTQFQLKQFRLPTWICQTESCISKKTPLTCQIHFYWAYEWVYALSTFRTAWPCTSI